MWYSESIIINTDEHHQNVLKRFRHKKLGHSFGRKVSGHNNKVVLLSNSSSLCACELSLDSWHWNQVYISFWINLVKNSKTSRGHVKYLYALKGFIGFWINIISWRHETDLIHISKFWLQYVWNKHWNVLILLWIPSNSNC